MDPPGPRGSQTQARPSAPPETRTAGPASALQATAPTPPRSAGAAPPASGGGPPPWARGQRPTGAPSSVRHAASNPDDDPAAIRRPHGEDARHVTTPPGGHASPPGGGAPGRGPSASDARRATGVDAPAPPEGRAVKRMFGESSWASTSAPGRPGTKHTSARGRRTRTGAPSVLALLSPVRQRAKAAKTFGGPAALRDTRRIRPQASTTRARPGSAGSHLAWRSSAPSCIGGGRGHGRVMGARSDGVLDAGDRAARMRLEGNN